MSDEFNEFSEYDELHSLMERHNLLSLFKKLPFKERVRRIVQGLKADKQSGEYKWARLQVTRMTAPASALLVPVVGLLILSLLASMAPKRERVVDVTVQEKQEVEELDEKIEMDKDPIQPPEPIEAEFTPDIAVQSDYENIVNAPTTELSPKPAEMDAVSMVKSPVMMKGILGNRNPGMRGRAMKKFGGSGKTEAAVMRALRWLKKHQESDGSWTLASGGGPTATQHTTIRDGAPVGITGLGVLTFLAHGETPVSEEFGDTIQRAIQYLVEAQQADGMFKSKDGRKNYSHLIATYALAEAFTLTKIPAVRDAAEKAMGVIIAGQHPDGGMDYGLKHSGRKDISMAAWAAQALKAGYVAGLSNPGLDAALTKAVDGLKLNYRKQRDYGYFAYTQSDKRFLALTGAAVLGMQLLGAAQDIEVRNAMAWLDQNVNADWANPKGMNNPIYNWYYITQAMFHEGGATWDAWNAQIAPSLVNSQTIEPKAIEDMNGNLVDIGYWQKCIESEWTHSYSYNTTLCALQLMVYYRYLPTFQKPDSLDQPADEFVEQEGEIEIEISI